MENKMDGRVTRFLDQQGRIKQIPAKMKIRRMIYEYLAGKFAENRIYDEQEVNEIISGWSTTNDYFTIRRGLIESGLLSRNPSGSEYRKLKPEA
ncbi:MAG TPA: DUF2087 domain-containing protein [Firmicutes bacterium]|nr:DUF2087 domain-containing protein [Bacillota bacterium]